MNGVSVQVELSGGAIEVMWVGLAPVGSPTLVLLHEGLGSVSLWRDFPHKLAAATGCRVMAYSRYGYGRSAPCKLPRPLDYMEREAQQVLPELLHALRIDDCVLIGHSDGASIALIYAGSVAAPGLRGVVVEAPHVFVEDVSISSIDIARVAWETTDLRDRLIRHHGDNVDCAFRGWNEAWLSPGFRDWDITRFLANIDVPLLAIQGYDDEYGTVAQIETICDAAGGARLMLEACGHSPHRDQEAATLAAMSSFIHDLSGTLDNRGEALLGGASGDKAE